MKISKCNFYMRYFLIIAVLSWIMPTGLLAQTPIIPPSPEASNIARYADIPVSLYTGKPQIEFPLYILKCGSIELTISLPYYATGIKVEDYPTWAGIGWALNAGGVIARTIRGPSKGNGGNNLGQYLPIPSYPSLDDFYNLVNLGDGYHNTESDIFYYNFCQYSGSFQIKNNTPVFRKYANLKIEYPIDLSTITITDENGNKYYFEPEVLGTAGNDYYLKKIESVNKSDVVYFEYIQGDLYIIPPHNSDFYSLKNTVSKIGTTSQINEIKNSGKLLRKIYTSNNDSVVFIKKDILLPGSSGFPDKYRKALDSVIVYNSKSKLLSFHIKTNNVQTIKPFEPNAAYPFGYTSKGTSEMDSRLYLDGFDEIDAKGNVISSYSFEYYGRTNDGRDSLANRYSFAQDLGGYYNGQDNNNSLIPSFNQTIYPFSDLESIDGFNCIDFDHYVSSVSISGANRNPNLQYMRMGTLKSVKYPTGGYAKFYFSQMDNPLNLEEPLWSLKIDSIEYLNSDGSLQKCKKYRYSDPVLGYPIPSYWHYMFFNLSTNQTSPYPYCDCIGAACTPDWGWAMELSPNNVYDLGMNEGPLVGYGYVQEYEDGNGHTTYTFFTEGASYDDYPNYYFVVDGILYDYDSQPPHFLRLDINNTWPLGPIPNNNWKMGTLINKKIISENNTLKQETDYHYSHLVLETIPGIKIFPVRQDFFYLYYQFNYFSTWEKLDSISETIEGVSKVTRYDYNDHKQVAQIETNNSDGSLLTTKLRYPSDINNSIYASMADSNMINYPIEQTSKVDGNWTKSTLTTYKTDDDNYVPDKTFIIDTESPLTSFMQFDGSNKDPNYSSIPEISYQDYNSQGRLTKTLGKNGIFTYYVWAYNNQYPVAKIESSKDVTISITVNDDNLSKSDEYDSDVSPDIQDDVSYLEGLLATYISNKDYMVTLYTYKPLVGMTSQTDPNGITTYYEYDDFGRLETVRDADGKVLQHHQYHYKQ